MMKISACLKSIFWCCRKPIVDEKAECNTPDIKQKRRVGQYLLEGPRNESPSDALLTFRNVGKLREFGELSPANSAPNSPRDTRNDPVVQQLIF